MQNLVILIGNIGQAPETNTTQGGTKISRFPLATSRPRYSDGKVMRDENDYLVEETEWHRIVAFNGLAKAVEKVGEKGARVFVRGRIKYTKWTDRDGVDRYGSEIIAEEFQVLVWPKKAEDETGAAGQSEEA